MIVTVNDKSEEIVPSTSLESLMEKIEVEKQGTAVALNNIVVPHSKWGDTLLKDNDSIVVIRATQGG